MNVNEVGDNFNCDCGFSWRRGQSGSHSCGDGLRKQIAELKAQRDALAADREKFAVQCAAAKIAVQYAQAAGFECTLNTPDVDAYLNSVRAEGVDMARDKLLKYAFPTMRQAYNVEAAMIADQLRAGEPS